MMYPLVRELAAEAIAVAVTCRVLKIARQPYYRWLAQPVTAAELTEAYRANALFDAHREDPEFGYQLLNDEAADVGQVMAERTAWRLCSAQEWWCRFGCQRRAKTDPVSAWWFLAIVATHRPCLEAVLTSLRRVKKGPGRRPFSEKRDRFLRLRERGWSILRAAREVGVSRTTANNWVRGYKVYRVAQVLASLSRPVES